MAEVLGEDDSNVHESRLGHGSLMKTSRREECLYFLHSQDWEQTDPTCSNCRQILVMHARTEVVLTVERTSVLYQTNHQRFWNVWSIWSKSGTIPAYNDFYGVVSLGIACLYSWREEVLTECVFLKLGHSRKIFWLCISWQNIPDHLGRWIGFRTPYPEKVSLAYLYLAQNQLVMRNHLLYCYLVR